MPFDLRRSLDEAERRFGGGRVSSARRRRSDAGRSRLPEPVATALAAMLRGYERPPMHALQSELETICRRLGERMPARATIYRFMAHCPPSRHRIAELPEAVRQALYNLDADGEVPGHQLAYYAFNYGDARAMSFAAGLPWLDLYQAAQLRGWRPRSFGVLQAVMRRRGI